MGMAGMGPGRRGHGLGATIPGALLLVFLGGCGEGADAPRPLGAEGAHEHGVARLDLSIEGSEGALQFRAPAAEIYGFEHAPRTEEEMARREAGLRAVRERIAEAVRFAPELECSISVRDVADDHGAHGHDDHGAHGHDDHGAHGHDDHGDHSHSDVEATFDITCAGPLAGSRLTLAFDRVFPGIVDVDLQVVGERSFGGRYRAAGARIDL